MTMWMLYLILQVLNEVLHLEGRPIQKSITSYHGMCVINLYMIAVNCKNPCC